jgi:hypothetical protein
MEALNFCRQIRKQTEHAKRVGVYDTLLGETPSIKFTAELYGAVKFVLPHGGTLLDDASLRGLDELQGVRLPFGKIVLEYTTPKKGGGVSKTVVLCVETDADIRVITWMTVDTDFGEYWAPYPVLSIDRVDGFIRDDDKVFLNAKPRGDMGVFTEERHWRAMCQRAVAVMLMFLNALACSNVTSERLPLRKPSKTLGALPFDEYHVLTIAAPQGTHKGGVQGSHRSPREHLRRGHIRRLQSGSKIWVNAAVINAGVGGKIRKQYALA